MRHMQRPIRLMIAGDVLFLDLLMERSALEDIAALAEQVRIIVVTARERPEDALAAVRLGARAVVRKRFAIETPMAAVVPSPPATSGCHRSSRNLGACSRGD